MRRLLRRGNALALETSSVVSRSLAYFTALSPVGDPKVNPVGRITMISVKV